MVHSTKDELQALEADLRVLVLANKDLSNSNKSLAETIAVISRAVTPISPKVRSPSCLSPAMAGRGTSRAAPVTSLFAMSPTNLPQIVPRKPVPSDRLDDHLQRCMRSVQDLAQTVTCALAALQGREKTGSSDIHASYARLVADIHQLPPKVQCVHCKRSVTWFHLDPPKLDSGQVGACVCMRRASPSIWEPCHDQLLSDPTFGKTSTPQRTFPTQGGQPLLFSPSINSSGYPGIAEPIENRPLSRPISPSNVPIDPNIRRRSFSEMLQQPPPQMHMIPADWHSPQPSPYQTSIAGAKRGPPPQAHDGKYYCNFSPDCADLYFDRKCEWR